MPKDGGVYLYAVMKGRPNFELDGLQGIIDPSSGQPGEFRVIAENGLSALVSTCTGKKVRPERRNLSSHHKVLMALLESNLHFLPVAFGVKAPSPKSLMALIAANKEQLMEEIDRLVGRVEMDLKLRWDVNNIFEFFIHEYPELTKMRDEIFAKGKHPSREEQIALGQAFESLLNQTRQSHESAVKSVLESIVLMFESHPPREDNIVFRLSCLIEKEKDQAFSAAVFEAAKYFDDNYTFDFNGPTLPFSFIRVSLKEPAIDNNPRLAYPHAVD